MLALPTGTAIFLATESCCRRYVNASKLSSGQWSTKPRNRPPREACGQLLRIAHAAAAAKNWLAFNRRDGIDVGDPALRRATPELQFRYTLVTLTNGAQA